VTEATEAPATSSETEAAVCERTESAVAAFRRQLEGQDSVPASVVQDGLLDLWGLLPEGDTRSTVERWLTETLERNLYSVRDVDSRLESVFASQN
jgi:hypothetical protein